MQEEAAEYIVYDFGGKIEFMVFEGIYLVDPLYEETFKKEYLQ